MHNELYILYTWLKRNGLKKEAIAVRNLIPLFVYGTLRRGERNHDKLKGAEFLGERVLFGYTRTIGIGPAIVPNNEDDYILGELYSVRPNVLEEIDEYEGEEYPRELVSLEDGSEAYAYIYRPKHKSLSQEDITL